MKARRGWTTEDARGVSQVIGIVLLVGITVVLVGVTAVYLTNTGSQPKEPAPRFSGQTDLNSTFAGEGQYLDITHQSGAKLDTGSIHFDVDGATVRSGGSSSGKATYDGNVIETQAGDEFTASETISLKRTAFVDGSGNPLTGSDYLDLTDATVRIIWENEDGTRTEIIYTCEVGPPDCAGN